MSEVLSILALIPDAIRFHDAAALTDKDREFLNGLAKARCGVINQATSCLQVVAEYLRLCGEKEDAVEDLNSVSWLILLLNDVIARADFLGSEAEYILRGPRQNAACTEELHP